MTMPSDIESTNMHLSRRGAIQQLAAGATLAGTASAQAQGPNAVQHDSTPQEFVRLMKQLSNWNRWGADDQMGAVNLITPARRRAALRTVREGASFSMARNAEIKEAVDNAAPIVRKTTRTGASQPKTGIASTSDTFFISYHGMAHTHMDSLCHFVYDGKIYNGYPSDVVGEDGAAKNSIINFKNGIITRGVLMDMARYKGVDYLEPGTAIYPEDLEGWERKAGVKVGPGDVMIVRTGRWARRDAKGPWPVQQLAGLHMSCAPWMHARDVAILGGDDAQDVLPSRVEGVSQPIHALCIVAMGMPIFDNCELELVGREAEKRRRWEFLVTASPAAVPGATGSVLNPIATF
jgi:kynurenine formamidase